MKEKRHNPAESGASGTTNSCCIYDTYAPTYQAVNSLAVKINDEHLKAVTAATTALDHAIKIGEMLNEAKRQLKHGEWITWVSDNLSFGDRQARKYMQIFEARDTISNRNCGSVLGINAAIQLLAPPVEAEFNIPLPCPHPGGQYDEWRAWRERHIDSITDSDKRLRAELFCCGLTLDDYKNARFILEHDPELAKRVKSGELAHLSTDVIRGMAEISRGSR